MDKKTILDRLKKWNARTRACDRWDRWKSYLHYSAEKGSGREVLATLSDSELVFLARLRFMLAEENPVVAAWDADHWASKFAYGKRDISELRDTYALMRRTFLELYRKSDEADLARPGR